LRAATAEKHFLYPAAWQSRIRTQVERKLVADALTSQLELAHRLERSQSAWPTGELKLQLAHWNGRMMGFLIAAAELWPSMSDKLAKADADVQSALTSAMRAEYDHGKRAGSSMSVKRSAEAIRLLKERGNLQAELDEQNSAIAKLEERKSAALASNQELLASAEKTRTILIAEQANLDQLIAGHNKMFAECKKKIELFDQQKTGQKFFNRDRLMSEQAQLTMLLSALHARRTVCVTELSQAGQACDRLRLERKQIEQNSERERSKLSDKHKLAEAKLKTHLAKLDQTGEREFQRALASIDVYFPRSDADLKQRVLDSFPATSQALADTQAPQPELSGPNDR
jgi:hypothetical protein